MPDELPEHYGSNRFLTALTIVGVMAISFSLFIRASVKPPVSENSALLGRQFPAIEVRGWINGPGPTAEDLQGKVVLVDAWAFWCGPCRMVTPQIIDLYNKYKDRNTAFLGLTSEGIDPKSLELSEQFVRDEKMPWPNGYGATKTLSALEVEGIPQFWIFDRDRRIIFHEIGWAPDSLEKMERALLKALDEPTKTIEP